MLNKLCVILITVLAAVLFYGCESLPIIGKASVPELPEQSPLSDSAGEEDVSAPVSAKPYIAVISKGLPERYWQAVEQGAKDAAKKYDIITTFDALPAGVGAESQAGAMKNAVKNNVSAFCIAGLDAAAIAGQLENAAEAEIPVLGFDTGIPGAPGETVLSTAATDNYLAGALAAQSMFGSVALMERVRNATPARPVTIAVHTLSPGAGAVAERTRGFLDTAAELAKKANKLGVRVEGGGQFGEYGAEGEGAVVFSVKTSDESGSARNFLETEGLIGYFCASQETAERLLRETAEGAELDRGYGKYKDLIVIGFDAGTKQVNAVKNRYFYGSVAQNPYQMGYMSVELAYTALQRESVPEKADTGSLLYTYENMRKSEISRLLYD